MNLRILIVGKGEREENLPNGHFLKFAASHQNKIKRSKNFTPTSLKISALCLQ